MTTGTAEADLTARVLLLGGNTDPDLNKLRRALSDHGVLKKVGGELAHLTPQAREAANGTLASVTAGLLDFDLGDALISGWRTHERLIHAAEETQRVPGRQEVVQLASHQVSWSNQSAVDLLIDGVRVHTFRFQLTLLIDIEVAAAVVQGGKLVAVKTGDGTVSGALALEMPGGDITLLQAERKINMHLIVRLGSGVPLLEDKPDLSATAKEAEIAGEETVPA
jgi:hypothetical protein